MEDAQFAGEVARLVAEKTPRELATDESFWARWAERYERDESFVQLNYGFYHPALRPVLAVEIETMRELNRRGAHFKEKSSAAFSEAARADLAGLAGVDAEEVAIVRNASEALNIVIQGIDWQAGDEVVCSDHDYGAMTQAWETRTRDGGVRVRQVALPLEPRDDAEIVRLFAAEITPRTRLLHVTHLVHFTGQLLPLEKLCALARERGVAVLVDAAHSFAQVEFSIRELACDYLGASLHKWLGAPLGTGLLYVRRDRIAGVRPLFASTRLPETDIRKFEQFGNRSDSIYAGLREAIRWHHALGGTAVKRARLAYLQRSWTEVVRTWPRFRVLTPREAERHGALGLVVLDGVPAEQLCDYLLREHGLFAMVQTPRLGPAVRITPGLPTSRAHIDRLLAALQAAERHFFQQPAR